MKKHILDFLKRGLVASGGGPVVAAVVYGILGVCGVIETLTPNEVCLGILSAWLMAFIAAGISVVYQIEQLSLFSAIAIHGTVLYADYILIYLLNGWLKTQLQPVLIFTGVFVAGYAIIWAVIYFTTRVSAQKLNRKLSET